MLIHFSKGKIIASPFEIQVRLAGVTLTALAEDIKCHAEALLLIANAGAVSWTLVLDNLEQLQQLCEQLGIELS